MKILICTGIFPPEVGGPATYTRKLAEALVQRGHSVQVVTYSNDKPEGDYSFAVIRVKRSWFKPWHYFKYYLAVKKYGRDADVLFAQDPVSSGYPTYLANKRLKKKYVLKVVGDRSWETAVYLGITSKLLDEFQKQGEYEKKIVKMREIQSLVAKSADLVITPSKYLKNIVSGWGVAQEKIEVIYNSVELPDHFAPKQKSSKFLIVSAGRDVPWKGFDLLKKVVNDLENVDLKIYTDLPRKEFLRELKSADVFILVTNVGGNPEVVVDGENGLLFQYNNEKELREGILKLYKDKKLRDKFASAGKETVKRYNFESMVDSTERALKSVT